MIPINKVRDLISRHKQLEKELSSSEIEKKEFAKKSKDYSNLNEIIEIAKKIECYQNNKTDLENIINDDKNERDMIDLAKLETSTIKVPKLQETSTFKLISCFSKKTFLELCNENVKKEIVPILNRRIALPFYIPIITLLSCILLVRSKRIFYNKFFVFLYSFSVLLYVELIIRHTGLNSTFSKFFILFPAITFPLIYFFLLYKFKNETKLK